MRDLLVLAWPLVVSRATQTIVGLADALMVAHLGAGALAATTAGANNAFLVLILPMGCVFIVQSFASQLFGKGDVIGARRFALYGLAIALVTQIVAMLAIPAIDPVLSLFSYETDVRRAMSGYLVYRLLSAGPAIGIEALGAYYGGVGRTRVPMIANLVLMVLNVGLNWALIDGHLGAPALGVEGAAIASSVATTLAFVGLLAYFLRDGALSRPRVEEFVRTLRFGLPSGLNWFFEFFAFNLFVNVVVAGLGTEVLAALMAVMQINAVSFMPAFALGSSGAILVGQSIGRDDRDDVPRIVRMTFGTAATWQGLVGLAYLLLPALIFAPFASDPDTREALVEVGVRMLMLSTCWQLFDSAATVLAEALRAAGDTVWPLGARLVLAWLVFVPGSWLGVRVLEGGDVAAMLCLTAYLALLALLLYVRFRSGKWRTLEITEPEIA
ncbi:Multidrug and toxin extrusion (MATE) family efflux pump YdhE/NorM [Sandaracinus amylolyticus]|uniref:Multidrug-efflux transporter n=1 Tax=Sandaracinus amylolyticus TaxID=927083 RepID=A0A0F6YMN8_9BACT|nr:Multidrug and toxin extrusion (MATE) family efflux pump YdhE/NorM [Sandaracinus amylolyticus]